MPGSAASRTLLALAAIVVAAGLASCNGCGVGAPMPPGPMAVAQPNVLLFVIDTCRADRCSVMGHTRPTTPHAEDLARRGARFTDAWSPSSWTAPAHASLFTGLLPTSHGLMLGNRTYLPQSAETLAEILGDAGWATGCFAENTFFSSSFGLTQGFQYVDAVFQEPVVEAMADRTQERAADWTLARVAEGRPFFTFVNVLEPHTPHRTLEPWRSAFLPDATPEELEFAAGFEVPESLGWALGKTKVTPREVDLVSRAYDAEVAAADDAFGKLLARLEAAGALDDTIVILTSDHGENLGEHRLFDHVGSLHRTLLHVPLVVRAKGVWDDGRTVRDPVRLEDLFPTLLELCRRPVPTGLDARSLLRDVPGRTARAALGPSAEARRLCVDAFGELPPGPFERNLRSVYDGTLHLIEDDTGRVELYDVEQDPLEEHDLSTARPGDCERLRGELLPFGVR